MYVNEKVDFLTKKIISENLKKKTKVARYAHQNFNKQNKKEKKKNKKQKINV